jgi:uncharacterized protein (DUF697 family)
MAASCFPSQFFSNEWDLVHTSCGEEVVNVRFRFIFSLVLERAQTSITFASAQKTRKTFSNEIMGLKKTTKQNIKPTLGRYKE